MTKKPKTKIHLLNATIRDGEHEHSAHVMIEVGTDAEVDRAVESLFAKSKDGFDAEDSYFGYGDGLTITDFKGSRPITHLQT